MFCIIIFFKKVAEFESIHNFLRVCTSRHIHVFLKVTKYERLRFILYSFLFLFEHF